MVRISNWQLTGKIYKRIYDNIGKRLHENTEKN